MERMVYHQTGKNGYILNGLKFFNVYLFLRETETEYEWVRGR